MTVRDVDQMREPYCKRILSVDKQVAHLTASLSKAGRR